MELPSNAANKQLNYPLIYFPRLWWPAVLQETPTYDSTSVSVKPLNGKNCRRVAFPEDVVTFAWEEAHGSFGENEELTRFYFEASKLISRQEKRLVPCIR